MPAKKSPLQVRIAPSTPVTFDVAEREGKTKKLELSLSFDVNTMIRIEEKTDLNMLNMLALWTRLNMTVLRAALWAAILPNHPEYESAEGFGAIAYILADEANRERAVEALWNAYLAFLPKDKREDMIARRQDAERAGASGEASSEEDPEGKKTAEAIGSSSGPSPVSTSASVRANSAS